MYIALAIASRVAPIERFPHGRSLANFLGLTPGCRSSGETERMGSITKMGSRLVRFLLGQVVLHLLRRDGTVRAWYQRIKRRRGTNIARVALMRRTVTIMWRMLTTREAWRPGSANAGAEAAEVPRKVRPRRGRRTVWSALSQAAPHAESTGSSSLLTSEEVTPCQA